MLTIRYIRPSIKLFPYGRHWIIVQSSTHSQSTKISDFNDQNKKNKSLEKYPLIDTNFDQYKIAYQYRRTSELLRGYLVYQMFSINFFVNNQDKIAFWVRRVLGDRLFKVIFKISAFGHFVGGENPQELIPVIKKLQEYSVQPILDYSIESDTGDASTLSSSEIDRIHDENTEKFIECIQTARKVCGENNSIAIKVTALIQPTVLKKLNNFLQSAKEKTNNGSIFELINQSLSNKLGASFQSSELNFSSLITENGNASVNSSSMNKSDWNEVFRLAVRLNRIAQSAVENKIFIMVDAEQTYFQTGINFFANQLQRYFNKGPFPFIYGTYQCYLKNTLNILKEDLALAEKYGYTFAAKLVRGAYMEQERRLAKQENYEDPINVDFETTSKVYHSCVDEVMKNILKRSSDKVRIMIASHNENTIRYTIQKMQENQIARESEIISFASLYGMSDYIAFALANAGYKTYKYLPYGPVEVLQPYLFRRAQENRSIFEKAKKDRNLHLKALQSRMFGGK